MARFEHRTPFGEASLGSPEKIAQAGYPTGVLIAPVILEPGWEEDYRTLLEEISRLGLQGADIRFEIISHRFTTPGQKANCRDFPGIRFAYG